MATSPLVNEGDRSASDALLEHRRFVRSLARSLVGGQDGKGAEDGDDLAQEILAAGLERPVREPRAWRAWLRRTAWNLAATLRRGRERTARRERSAAAREALPSALELVSRLETEQRVVTVVLKLPEAERAVVLLRFYDGQEIRTIAARLGAPADTIRARLRRALLRLRGELDEGDERGGQGGVGWRHALAPLIAGRTLPLPRLPSPPAPVAPVAPVSIGALGIGAIVMSVKWASGVVVAAVLAMASAWFATPESWHPWSTSGAAHGPASAAAPPVVANRAALPAAAVAEAERASDAAPVAAENAAPLALPPPGLVAFRLVDAATQSPIDDVKIRFLGAHRFAEYGGASDGSAKLTAGSWAARATAATFEPVELGAFTITDGATTDLGTIALVHGSGVIHGRVAAHHLEATQSATVELYGDGRAPCPECAARETAFRGWQEAVEAASDEQRPVIEARRPPRPGDCCGFSVARSLLEVADGGGFEFRGLAAGTYWLRATADGARLIELRRIDLGRHGEVWIDLDLTAPTTLLVQLRHPGGPFPGIWRQPHIEETAPIAFNVTVGEQARGTVRTRPETADVRAAFGAPIEACGESVEAEPARRLAELAVEADGEFLHEALVARFERITVDYLFEKDAPLDALVLATVQGTANPDDRLDRELADGDALVAEPAAPKLGEVDLGLEKCRSDEFRLTGLPRATITLQIRCGAYESEAIPIDLSGGYTGPFVAVLRPPEDGGMHAAQLAGAARSCAACHDGDSTRQALRETRDRFQSRRELALDRLLVVPDTSVR